MSSQAEHGSFESAACTHQTAMADAKFGQVDNRAPRVRDSNAAAPHSVARPRGVAVPCFAPGSRSACCHVMLHAASTRVRLRWLHACSTGPGTIVDMIVTVDCISLSVADHRG